MRRSYTPLRNSLCRVVLLGDQGVGKSSYVTTLFEEEFDESYNPTIGNILHYLGVDYRAKHLKFSNQQSRIHIFDSSGHPQLKNISKSLYQYAQGFIFMYSIEDKSSFVSIKEWIETVNRERKPKSSSILVANKRDSINRQVSEQEGRVLAETYNMQFYQTSSKLNENVLQSVGGLVQNINKLENINKLQQTKKRGQISYIPLFYFVLLLLISLFI